MKIFTSNTKTEIKLAQTDPNEILVEMGSKRKPLMPSIKKSIGNKIRELGDFHDQIPLDQIFGILDDYDITPVQEDGTKWSGMLLGGAECGSEEANKQYVIFQLALWQPDNTHVLLNCGVHMTWCKMQSGQYEIISYIS